MNDFIAHTSCVAGTPEDQCNDTGTGGSGVGEFFVLIAVILVVLAVIATAVIRRGR
jgi:hypothetical protein